MSINATVCDRVKEEQVTRTVDFEELYRELVEEAGKALEEGDLAWAAIVQEILLPKIEGEGLAKRTRAA